MKCTVVLFSVIWCLRLAHGLAVEESRGERANAVMSSTLSTLSTVLGAIGFIKLKIMLVLVAAFFVVGLLSKLLGGLGAITCGGLGIACPPGQQGAVNGYSTGFFSYSQPDYTFTDSYRAYSDPDFFSSIARSIDFMDMSFKILGVEDVNCKKKFVCMAENEAMQNPLFKFAVKILGNNLTKYQDFGLSKQKKKDCNSLYPECKMIMPTLTSKEFDDLPGSLQKQSNEKPATTVLQNSKLSSVKL